MIVRYWPGGFVAGAPAGNMASQIDATTVTTWDQQGNVTGTRPPTTAELALLTAQSSSGAVIANAQTLQGLAANALATNQTYLGLAPPTAAQVAAQVNVLTRECSALIRLLLGRLDSTSGT